MEISIVSAGLVVGELSSLTGNEDPFGDELRRMAQGAGWGL